MDGGRVGGTRGGCLPVGGMLHPALGPRPASANGTAIITATRKTSAPMWPRRLGASG